MTNRLRQLIRPAVTMCIAALSIAGRSVGHRAEEGGIVGTGHEIDCEAQGKELP
jgi:hypothetical protein